MTKWTQEKIEKMEALWERGLPASQIATILGAGFTRNSVLGKRHRLGGTRRESPEYFLKKITRAKTMPLPKQETFKGVKLEDLSPNGCKWPSGMPPGSPYVFCDCVRLKGSPYCERHTDRAFRDPTKFCVRETDGQRDVIDDLSDAVTSAL